MTVQFEWDEDKAAANLAKHATSFDEASTVFNDAFSLTIYDEAHSFNEERYIDIGTSQSLRLLVVVYVVVYTERGSHIRIISARQATTAERSYYEQRNT